MTARTGRVTHSQGTQPGRNRAAPLRERVCALLRIGIPKSFFRDARGREPAARRWAWNASGAEAKPRPPSGQSVSESLELLVHLILSGLEGGLGIDLTADGLVDVLDEGVLHGAGRVEDVGVGLGQAYSFSALVIHSANFMASGAFCVVTETPMYWPSKTGLMPELVGNGPTPVFW